MRRRTRAKNPEPVPPTAAWDDAAFSEARLSFRYERSEGPASSRWHSTLVRPGGRGPALARVDVDLHTFGPVALRRTVRVEAADRSVRLELGRGLELGVGMPRWLRAGRAFVGDESVGSLTVEPGLVRLAGPAGTGGEGAWRFDGKLLGYVGLPEPVVYGEVTWAGRRLGELLAPRLHTYHLAVARDSVPLWRGVEPGIDEPSRRWMLAITALAVFCLSVGEEWHSHQPNRAND